MRARAHARTYIENEITRNFTYDIRIEAIVALTTSLSVSPVSTTIAAHLYMKTECAFVEMKSSDMQTIAWRYVPESFSRRTGRLNERVIKIALPSSHVREERRTEDYNFLRRWLVRPQIRPVRAIKVKSRAEVREQSRVKKTGETSAELLLLMERVRFLLSIYS